MTLPKPNGFAPVVAFISLSVITGVFLVGCDTSSSNSEGEQVMTSSDDFVAGEFDGIWRARCFEHRTFMVPDEGQPAAHLGTLFLMVSLRPAQA